MKFVSIAIVLGLITAASQAQEKPAPTDVSGKIDWVFDLETGQRMSQNTGKPMFVVFRCER